MVTSQVQLKDIRVDRAARRISLVDLHAFLREGDASSAGSQLGKLINRPICSHLIYASKHKFSFLKQDNRRGKSIPAVISNSQLRLCILDIWNALLSSRKGTSKRLDGFRRQYLVLQSQFQTIFGSLWEDEVHDWPDLTTAPVPTSNAQRCISTLWHPPAVRLLLKPFLARPKIFIHLAQLVRLLRRIFI